MTIRAFLNKKNIFAPAFFFNTLKKSWTNFVLYFIVCLFTFPVPLLLSVQSGYYSMTEVIGFDDIVARIVDTLGDLSMISVMIAAMIAVFAGCVTTKYLNSKTSAYFYHSLPIRREAIYLTKTAVSIVNYVAAFVLSVLIGAFVILVRIGYAPEIVGCFAHIIGYSLLAFLTIFSITVFVGMFCGTTGVHFVMTGVTLFIVPATYVSVLFLLDQYMSYIDVDWYMGDIFRYTSPIMRFFYLYDYPFSVLEIIIFILLVIVFAILALIVYLHRKNENAGNPIVFPEVASFLKYLIMIPVTIVMGLWFGEMGGGLWQIFGFAAGALLTFMLINVVFAKNARAMFKGVRGFAVFCAAFAILYLGTVFDVLNLDEYIPSHNLVSSIELEMDGQYYGKYTDKEIIDKLETDLERYMNERDHNENAPYDDMYGPYAEASIMTDISLKKEIACNTKFSVNVVYYTKLGTPIAKFYPGVSKIEFEDTLRAIANSDEFEKIFYDFIDYKAEYGYEYIDLPPAENFKIHEYSYSEGIPQKELEAYKKDLGDITYETFQYPQVAYMSKRIRGAYSDTRFELPIFINSKNTLDIILQGNDVYDMYFDSIHSINVYRAVDEKQDGTVETKRVEYTDREDIVEILSCIANGLDYFNPNIFCQYDYRYFVEIRYYKDAEYVKHDGKYVFNEEWIGPVSYFIDGKVPALVENAFN